MVSFGDPIVNPTPLDWKSAAEMGGPSTKTQQMSRSILKWSAKQCSAA